MDGLNDRLRRRVLESLVGGVNSPVRTFANVNSPQMFAASGSGARLTSAAGDQYIDFLMSWGVLILGHSFPPVVEAICETAANGCSFGVTAENECRLAELVRESMPSIELIRFVNSGTEAAMSALRLARGYTGKSKILKFEGCYHGHCDSLLVRAGSGLAGTKTATSAGVPDEFLNTTLLAPYNDLEAAKQAFENCNDIAAVIVEPVAGNMGVVPPNAGFLEGLRELCTKHGSLLIFDEVITGFRLAPGGAQEYFGVTPDLTVLGKIIGGGLPIGAFGGKAEVMTHLAPLGDVYQAGTFSGNPVVAAAGCATLKELRANPPYEKIASLAATLVAGVEAHAEAAGVEVTINSIGSMFTVFFASKPIQNYSDAQLCKPERYAAFFRGMIERGILLPPSQWESSFISAAHDAAMIDEALARAGEALRAG